MAMTTHTPGPWTHDGGGSVSVVINGRQVQVAMACGQAAMCDERAAASEVMRANGDLLAAAPDLLAALHVAVEALKKGVGSGAIPRCVVDTGEWCGENCTCEQIEDRLCVCGGGAPCDNPDCYMGRALHGARAAMGKVGQRLSDGTPGVRDVDAPCDEFSPGTPDGNCESDGHHLCDECKHYLTRRTCDCCSGLFSAHAVVPVIVAYGAGIGMVEHLCADCASRLS